MPDDFPFRVFDPADDVLHVERKLPHWSQPGTIAFITFRTWDSMPAAVVQRWVQERSDWLHQHGIDSESANWRQQLEQLASSLRQEFHRRFSQRWHEELDACHGTCVLRQSQLSQIVANSLEHFDGDRYVLTDLVVMPNHVHVLAAFPNADALLTQCESWKHYTATQINRQLARKGRFWQQDGFDHLVRSVEKFEYLRLYIARNPTKANLGPGEFIHKSKVL
ncbi:MAG: transposase [Planctomycetes bacterium]|nr:transposase [Planctomycetota bacterium]